MDSPSLSVGHCYCGALEAEQHMLECQKCRKLFHPGCLTSGRPSNIVGDTYFNFTCSLCSPNGTEEVERSKLLWTHVTLLTLYNLRLQGGGKCGFYRWREHICNFIDRNWSAFFGNSRKKSSTWHCTVAGTLSANCPQLFRSGTSILKESGWWALVDSHLPSPTELEILMSSQKVGRKSKSSLPDSPPKMGGLRLRSSKTPIQAAIELKERRSVLQEAKDIRKTRSPCLAQDIAVSSLNTSIVDNFPDINDSESLNCTVPIENQSFNVDVNTFKDECVSSVNVELNLNSSSISDYIKEEATSSIKLENEILSSDNLFKGSEIPLMKEEIVEEKEITDLSCLLPTEEDVEFDMDPNNITSPTLLTHSELPAVEDLLSTFSYMEEICIKDEPESEDSGSSLMRKPAEEKDFNAVGSEDEGISGSHSYAATVPEVGRKRKAVSKEEPSNKERESPQPKCQLMNIYEEQQLLKKLESMPDAVEKSAVARRLRRKLIVRKLKREQNIPLFNLDLQIKMLCGFQPEDVDNDLSEHIVPVTGRQENRILDRYQIKHYIACGTSRHRPNFVTRLMGLEEDEESIISPYTERVLKPYIFRDFETVPMKLRLLKEIVAYPHRKDANWEPPPHHPIDYCYVRAQHIPVVHSICKEFFWPGIDLNDCLKFPDFSCIALYRKVVIGFAFMVPDSSYNEAYITFIFTHPEWRRAGIAKFMLYHLIQTCMGKDVTLHVAATNPALLLYQKFGFKIEEFILDFYDKYLPADSKECRHAMFLRLSR